MATPQHRSAAIISVGDELVIGQKLDTNSRWLSARLLELGILTGEHRTVADDLDALVRTLRELSGLAPLLILTGGLGPTADDLTRPALAALLGEELITDDDALKQLCARFHARQRTVSDTQKVQALRPVSASMLDNPVGTAPGLTATHARCTLFCLPGPPREMQPMFENFVRPLLRPPSDRAVATRVLHTAGLPEADIADRLGALMDRGSNPVIGTTASGGMVSVRIRFEGPPEDEGRLMDAAESAVRTALDPFVFGVDADTLESVILDALRARGEMLVTVESCTGGLLGAGLTAIPGSSDAFLGGWITYANDLKERSVSVPHSLLAAHGAVSAPVARAMGEGALTAAPGAHHALSITGIAGPTGGSESKPVGTVFIARARRDGPTDVRRFLITGDRIDIRDRAALLGLVMLRFHLCGTDAPKLLWEVPSPLQGAPT